VLCNGSHCVRHGPLDRPRGSAPVRCRATQAPPPSRTVQGPVTRSRRTHKTPPRPSAHTVVAHTMVRRRTRTSVVAPAYRATGSRVDRRWRTTSRVAVVLELPTRAGLSHARAEGQASFEGRNLYGKISGNATGHANSVTGDGVSARTNQGDVAGGSSSTSFQQNASASLRGQSCDDCVRSVQQNASTLSNSFAVNTSYTGAVMNDSTPLNAAVTNMNITAKAGGDASSKSWALKQ
jgi:hypothetical protein